MSGWGPRWGELVRSIRTCQVFITTVPDTSCGVGLELLLGPPYLEQALDGSKWIRRGGCTAYYIKRFCLEAIHKRLYISTGWGDPGTREREGFLLALT
jgi:hypothetical protein